MSEKCRVFCKDCTYLKDPWDGEAECKHPSNIETKTHTLRKSWKHPREEFESHHTIKSPKVKNMCNDCEHFNDSSFSIRDYSIVLSIIVAIILVCWVFL